MATATGTYLGAKKLEFLSAMNSLKSLKGAAHTYSYAFGWPWIVDGAAYIGKGVRKAIEGIKWGAYAGYEAGKATTIGVGAVPFAAAASVPVAIKETLWDTGKAAFVAPFKMAWAAIKSPLEAARGVRDAVSGVFEHGKGFLNSLFSAKLGATVSHTRQAIGSLLKPFTRPLGKIAAPAAVVASTLIGAHMQPVKMVRTAITHTIPEQYQAFQGAGAVATAKIAKENLERDALKAQLKAVQEEKEAYWESAIAKHKGEPEPGEAAKAFKAFKAAKAA